jgi:hypothetical protein
MADFETAGNALKMAATIGGTYGDVTIDTGHNYVDTLKAGLLRSAWKHVYAGLNIERLPALTTSADGSRRSRSRRPSPWTTSAERPSAATSRTLAATSCAAR